MTNYDKHADEQGFTVPRWTVQEYAALPGDVIRHLVRYTDDESEQEQFDLDCRHNAWLVADRLNRMQEKYRWLLRQGHVWGAADVARTLYGGEG